MEGSAINIYSSIVPKMTMPRATVQQGMLYISNIQDWRVAVNGLVKIPENGELAKYFVPDVQTPAYGAFRPGLSTNELAEIYTNNLLHPLWTAAQAARAPKLFYFSASWCVACQKYLPTLKKIQSDFNAKVNMYYVDCTDSRAVANKNSVMAFPTIILIKEGKPFGYSGQLIGPQPEEYLRRLLNEMAGK